MSDSMRYEDGGHGETRFGTMRGSPTRAQHVDDHQHAPRDRNVPHSVSQYSSERSHHARGQSREPLSSMHRSRPPGEFNAKHDSHKVPAYGRRSHVSHGVDPRSTQGQYQPTSGRARSNSRQLHGRQEHRDSQSVTDRDYTNANTRTNYAPNHTQSHYSGDISAHQPADTGPSHQPASTGLGHQLSGAGLGHQPSGTGLIHRRKQALALLKKSTRIRPRASSTSAAAGGGLGGYGHMNNTNRSHARGQLPNSNPVTPQTRHNGHARSSSRGEFDASDGLSRPPVPVRARTYDPHASNPRSNHVQMTRSARQRGDDVTSHHAESTYRGQNSTQFSRSQGPPQTQQNSYASENTYESSPPRVRVMNPRRGRHQSSANAHGSRRESHSRSSSGFGRSSSQLSHRSNDG